MGSEQSTEYSNRGTQKRTGSNIPPRHRVSQKTSTSADEILLKKSPKETKEKQISQATKKEEMNKPVSKKENMMSMTKEKLLSFIKLEPSNDVEPSKREGHAVVYEDGYLYLFGGQNEKYLGDMYRYNTATNEWSEINLKTSFEPPSPRSGHSMVVKDSFLYVFGGDDSVDARNDTFEFSLADFSWKHIDLLGKQIEKRWNHAAVVYSESMFVFGGQDSDGQLFNDVVEFSFETKRWKQVSTTGEVPSKRYGMSGNVYKNFFIIFGGKDEEVNLLNDLYILDLESFEWKKVECKGFIPKRFGHASIIHNDVLWVFGGEGEGTLLNDLYKLPLETLTWEKVNTSGEIEPRSFHTLTLAQDTLYIFGGFNGTSQLKSMYKILLPVKETPKEVTSTDILSIKTK